MGSEIPRDTGKKQDAHAQWRSPVLHRKRPHDRKLRGHAKNNEHCNLDSRPNDEDLPIWLCVDPSRNERETRKDNGQIGAPMENNPAIPQLIGSRRLLTTISHGIPSSQQRCRNAALNRKSPDSENLFSHARRDARRADGKQRLRRRAPPIIHDVDQLRARGATSRLFQRLVRAWDVLDGAQAV